MKKSMQWISSHLLTAILLVIIGGPVFPDYFSSQKNYLDSRLDSAAKQQEATIKKGAKATANYRYDVRIDVIGMTTKEAARHIYDRFKVEKRVKKLNIDIYRQRLYIMLQPNQPLTDKDLKGLITSAGYGVRRIFRKSNHYDLYKKELQRIKKSNSRLLPNPSFDP